MAFLITGGASQVGTALASLLNEAGKKVIIASRSGDVPKGYETVKLDWADKSTIDVPFSSGEPIEGVYIMIPPGFFYPSDTVIAFINKAVAHGVKRFVLLGGSTVNKDHEYGKIWKYLDDKKLDYFALRPTTFMDNFLKFYGTPIRELNEFSTAMPNAKVPFISTVDIAELAFRAFTADKNESTDQYIIGPELLTYDQVAETLSEVLDRKITHKVITGEQLGNFYAGVLGWPEEFATFLVQAQLNMDGGSEERLWGKPEAFIGKETFKGWSERHKDELASASA